MEPTIVPLCSSPDFHCDLHGFHHGLVAICRGVYVVSLGLPCAQHNQHRDASLRQVCQLLQSAHLLRHELQVPPGRVCAAAVHARAPGGGASAALQKHQTQGRRSAPTRIASCPKAGSEIHCGRGEAVPSRKRLGGQQPPRDPSI